MSKLKSLEELKAIREKAQSNTNLRVGAENPDQIILAVGMATCGIAAGAREVMHTLLETINEKKVQNVSVIATGCIGYCFAEPLVEVREPNKEPIRYGNVDAGRAKEIIEKHIMAGELINNAIVGKEVPRA